MITLEDVKHGYERKVVGFANGNSFNGFDEAVCVIGNKGLSYNWFYFVPDDADGSSLSFVHDMGLDTTLKWVTNALNEIIMKIDEDEYAFYEAVLNEIKED